jgi:pimeloyl-ACP methyl ester carboxylesterase
VLDATRAVASLLSLHASTKEWVFFGHSQGGHAVLSAQAYANSYGLAGRLHTVVAVAPGWPPMREIGWSLSDEAGLNTHENYGQVWTAAALSYFVGHAERYDGEAASVSMIRSEKVPILSALQAQSDLVLAGDRPSDIFTAQFVAGIVPCATTGKDEDCTSELAKTWRPRFQADRPALDPKGADVLEWIAGQDELITLNNYRCGIDKIRADLAHSKVAYKICVDRPSGHSPIWGRQIAWLTQWLDAKFLGAAAPAACAGEDSLGPSFKELGCTPPGNND